MRKFIFSLVLLFVGVLWSEERYPASTTEDAELRYISESDGGVSTILESTLIEDYSNAPFPYKEFPEGLLVTHFSDSATHTIKADYGIIFPNTDVVYLEGNVVIKNAQKTINTGYLFFVQSLNHVYTEDSVSVTSDIESVYGKGLDSDSDFINLRVNAVKGVIQVDADEA